MSVLLDFIHYKNGANTAIINAKVVQIMMNVKQMPVMPAANVVVTIQPVLEMEKPVLILMSVYQMPVIPAAYVVEIQF